MDYADMTGLVKAQFNRAYHGLKKDVLVVVSRSQMSDPQRIEAVDDAVRGFNEVYNSSPRLDRPLSSSGRSFPKPGETGTVYVAGAHLERCIMQQMEWLIARGYDAALVKGAIEGIMP